MAEDNSPVGWLLKGLGIALLLGAVALGIAIAAVLMRA